MPRRSTIKSLPAEIQAGLQHYLTDNPGLTLDALTQWLNAHLEEQGVQVSVSRSALGRYRKSFEGAVQHMREMREMASAFAKDLPDLADDKSNQLLLEMMHSLLTKTVTHAQTQEPGAVSPDDVMRLAKAIQSSFSASKVDMETKAKIREQAKREALELAAAEAEDAAAQAGLTDEQFGLIRAKILGIEVSR